MLAIGMAAPAAAKAPHHLSLAQRLADPRPLVVAHRGCWRMPAENSLAGMLYCIDHGADMLEVDLRETADGELVVMHDATLDRTTNLKGLLRNTPAADVLAARLREGMGGPDAPLTDQHVPSFEQVLKAAKGRTLLFLDIKEPVHAEAAALVRRYGMEDSVLWSMNGTYGPALYAALGIPPAATMPKFDEHDHGQCRGAADAAADKARYAGVKADIYEAVFCSDTYLAQVRSVGGKAGIWVNALGPTFMAGREEGDALALPDKVWGELLDAGVTAIQTNFPEELKAYLRRR
ncbi:glycerophosphoryl diester phosphodiesterase [Novosphingobium sp. PhB57]|uniref:glycerophosphodiester phosphodiesterase family protein n=1 Tax=Novosphingobium sp. PhB57 TaxID=2485107 RepID=UPI00104736AC|nr:glycerophosphodiester phosphodiesterase family protein [Novosphingobium sp. PhB57]TCU58603.1 glycerophosphoryl diester phosphodiesterase [Novosphingobium sp. PhB57]